MPFAFMLKWSSQKLFSKILLKRFTFLPGECTLLFAGELIFEESVL